MTKKIHKNSICPLCKSGLKYRECCGKNEPLNGTSMRFISKEKVNPTVFEKLVYEKLGHYPDDYILPIKEIGDVIYVIIDESNIDDNYAIGGVVVSKSEIDRNSGIYKDLRELVDKYNIDYIHFTEMFGRSNILGDSKKAFLNEYADIVSRLDLKSFSACMSEEELKNLLCVDFLTKEQCYISLTWIMMFNILIYVTYKYGPYIIIEIWRERENITIDKRNLHTINSEQIIKLFPMAYVSIYMHYIQFSKEEVLFSSISDFLAYLAMGLYPKIKAGYPMKKLVNNYYDLLVLYDKVFGDTSGMKNPGLDELINMVRDREKHRQN